MTKTGFLMKLRKDDNMLCKNHCDDSSYTSSDRILRNRQKFAISTEAGSIIIQLQNNLPSKSEITQVSSVIASQSSETASTHHIDVKDEVIDTKKVCRACLAMDCKLLSLKDHNLEDSFLEVTGLFLCEELPETMCVECIQKLRGCVKFIEKCLKADELMMDIIKEQHRLTIGSVQSVDRKEHDLSSPLSHAHFDADHFDLYVDDNDHNKEDLDETDEPIYDSKDIVDEKYLKEDNVFASKLYEGNMEEEMLFTDYDEDTVEPEAAYLSDDSQVSRKRETEEDSDHKSCVKKKKKGKPNVPGPWVMKKSKWTRSMDRLKKLFTVIEVTKPEEMVAEFRKRMNSSNYINGKYKCDKCYRGYLDVIAYDAHMAKHTTAYGEYSCDVCSFHFNKRHSIAKHMRVYHRFRLICKKCPYETSNRETARAHEKFHQDTSYQCPHCPKIFVKYSTYMSHIRLTHATDFFCQLCGYTFVSEKGVQLHKTMKHRLDSLEIPEDGPWCEDCNVQFASEEALKRHEKMKHKKEIDRTYFSRIKKLRKETAMAKCPARFLVPKAKSVKEVECELCSKVLLGPRAYYAHFRTMHRGKNRTKYPSIRKQFMCETCGGIFSNNAHLREHSRVHTDGNRFPCELCGKSFALRYRRTAHMRIHSSEAPTFECSECGKKFNNYSNRQRHMYIHSKVRQFKCEYCGKGFKEPSVKRLHVDCVHFNKPWPRKKKKGAARKPVQLEDTEQHEMEKLEDDEELEEEA